ncbi:hypothetical protein ACVIRO_002355 [Rhizobium ruizarguesonis]
MTDTKHFMQALASGIDEILNGNVLPKKNGFVVLVFPFDQVDGARTNYVSNCDRKDIIAALKEVTARFEGQPHQTGRA